jgi:glutathione S-transferase
LGFKGLPYRTEWVEHPQIEATFKKIGAAPTGTRADGTGRPFYTVPVIIDPNHLTEGKPTMISDSRNIALYLDEHYPTNKQLIPNGTNGLQAVCEEYFIQNVVRPIAGHLMLRYHNILNEESQPYVPMFKTLVFWAQNCHFLFLFSVISGRQGSAFSKASWKILGLRTPKTDNKLWNA